MNRDCSRITKVYLCSNAIPINSPLCLSSARLFKITEQHSAKGWEIIRGRAWTSQSVKGWEIITGRAWTSHSVKGWEIITGREWTYQFVQPLWGEDVRKDCSARSLSLLTLLLLTPLIQLPISWDLRVDLVCSSLMCFNSVVLLVLTFHVFSSLSAPPCRTFPPRFPSPFIIHLQTKLHLMGQ